MAELHCGFINATNYVHVFTTAESLFLDALKNARPLAEMAHF